MNEFYNLAYNHKNLQKKHNQNSPKLKKLNWKQLVIIRNKSCIQRICYYNVSISSKHKLLLVICIYVKIC